MFVTPAPARGGIIAGRDVAGRVLRINAHPDADRVVLSIWQDGRCMATLRLAPADVTDLIRSLVGTLMAGDQDPQASDPQASAAG